VALLSINIQVLVPVEAFASLIILVCQLCIAEFVLKLSQILSHTDWTVACVAQLKLLIDTPHIQAVCQVHTDTTDIQVLFVVDVQVLTDNQINQAFACVSQITMLCAIAEASELSERVSVSHQVVVQAIDPPQANHQAGAADIQLVQSEVSTFQEVHGAA
jgi:hypothetical protein